MSENDIFSHYQMSLDIFELWFIIVADSSRSFILFLLPAILFIVVLINLQNALFIEGKLVMLILSNISVRLQFDAVEMDYVFAKFNFRLA